MTEPIGSHPPSRDGRPRGNLPRSECHPPLSAAGRAVAQRPNAPRGCRTWQEGKERSIWSLRKIPRLRGAQGSALLIVVVLLGTIAALVAVVSRSVSSAAMEAEVLFDEGRAESALQSGIDVGVASILKSGVSVRVVETAVDLIDSRVFVRASNESARVDLNKSPPPLLAGLIRESGVIPGAADALTERILNWRGGPGVQQGAVSAHLNSTTGPGAGRAVGAERVFVHPMQLASIDGFSDALVARMMPFLTVANTVGNIDPDLASDQVLAALGVSPERIDAFREARRRGAISRETAVELLGIPKSLVTAEAAQGWRIEITSTPTSGRVRRSEAVVVLLNKDIRPYRLLYVMDDPDARFEPLDETPN